MESLFDNAIYPRVLKPLMLLIAKFAYALT